MTFEIGYYDDDADRGQRDDEATGATFNLGGDDYSNTLIQVNSGGELDGRQQHLQR